MPAVVLVEMLAQVGGLAAGAPVQGAPATPLRLRVAALGPLKPLPARPGPAPGPKPGRGWPDAWAACSSIEGEVTADGLVVAAGSVTLAATG